MDLAVAMALDSFRDVKRGDADGKHAGFVPEDDVGEVPVADENELFARRIRLASAIATFLLAMTIVV